MKIVVARFKRNGTAEIYDVVGISKNGKNCYQIEIED